MSKKTKTELALQAAYDAIHEVVDSMKTGDAIGVLELVKYEILTNVYTEITNFNE